MGQKITAIKGTHDLFETELRNWRWIESEFCKLCLARGYSEIRTPYIEPTELFVRSLGESATVVGKEMYTFQDKKGLSISLRPEGTAPVVRAYIEAGLPQQTAFARFFYLGPMFRYEQPQKGRQRQFHQMGVEVFGLSTPAADCDVIALADALWRTLGMLDTTVLLLNSVGCDLCRPHYLQILVTHLQKYRSILCKECNERITTNPLRVFDCKTSQCRAQFPDFPKIIDHACADCSTHFSQLCHGLDSLHIAYELDPLLVRGLDYYKRSAFEWRAKGLGSQDALAGGGRYDKLVSELGGPEVPGIGFALGCERLLIAMEAAGLKAPVQTRLIDFLPLDSESQWLALRLQNELLRMTAHIITVNLSGASLKTQLKNASKSGVRYALIIGQAERDAGEVICKDMSTGEQKKIPFTDIAHYIQNVCHE